MQEEVENRTLTLVVSGTKFTGRLFKAAITKYLAHRKEKKLQMPTLNAPDARSVSTTAVTPSAALTSCLPSTWA